MLFQAYLTGWLVAAPIGPVNLEVIRRSLGRGLLSGWMVGLGATCVDFTYLILFSAGLGVAIEKAPGLGRALFIAGGALLIWLGISALRESTHYWKGKVVSEPVTAPLAEIPFSHTPAGHFVLGIAMCALNPMTLAFWSSLSLRFVDLSPTARLAAGGMVWLGALSWTVTLVGVLAFARRWVGPKMFAAVTAAGGMCLLYFGVVFLLRARH